MKDNEFVRDHGLLSISDLVLIPNADLSRRTSMATRCRAKLLAIPQSLLALRQLAKVVRSRDWPMMVLGGGTNTIFATTEFDGIVLVLDPEFFGDMEVSEENVLRVGAAADLKKLMAFSGKQHLMGLEFCTGIPGTVGGALAGNAGAGHFGLCDYMERCLVLDRDGMFHDVRRGEYRYSYRHSELANWIVMEAELRLEPLDFETARQRKSDYAAKKKSQPYSAHSSGCIFKNPKLPGANKSVSAGKLIDDAGMKNYALNSVVVSDKHANFIINTGDATGEQFLAMISTIQDIVYAKFGVELELEARIVGGPLTSCVMR